MSAEDHTEPQGPSWPVGRTGTGPAGQAITIGIAMGLSLIAVVVILSVQ
jgi:hypothetical protein